ncbi:Response regulator rcp1 [Acaryochloris thomasi RCC1774]|uniref:Response regulator rcp1 n=1 Tax=Acaryochloris thomasi RCC1774 TaxID=1764569 RepID=A0A2W1JQL7_9CYAN|nr:response regulator [Acaryochloris thomasi]PZD71207.1 Response regulator rcp1 [Acaryochloris thomasi RCC1774]
MYKQPSLSLLVVEDSNEDFEAFRRIVNEVGTMDLSIVRCHDGDDALEHLQQRQAVPQPPLPDVIVLDLNLPGTDGREVIAEVKQNDKLKTIPIVVLTTSSNPKDVEACYRFGANSYMLKSMDIRLFKASIQQFLDFWFKATVLPSSNQESRP